jgi:hypothetical protein
MINDHVCDLEHSKRLRDKGFPQDTEFYWVGGEWGPFKYGLTRDTRGYVIVASAPLATEILEILPKEVFVNKVPYKIIIGRGENVRERWWFAQYQDMYPDRFIHRSTGWPLPNALAELWMEVNKCQSEKK